MRFLPLRPLGAPVLTPQLLRPRARSGHTDAAALEALKQRWVKVGKPKLSDECVALRLAPQKRVKRPRPGVCVTA